MRLVLELQTCTVRNKLKFESVNSRDVGPITVEGSAREAEGPRLFTA